MTIQPFRAVYPNFDLIASPDAFFDTVKEEFPGYWSNGFFLQDDVAALFVYEIKAPGKSHVGLIASMNVEDYFAGRIKPHENTIAAKEQQMTKLFLERRAMIKPVLLSYKPHPEISAILDDARKGAPFIDIRFEGPEEHRVYKITDGKVILKLQDLFRDQVARAYIADGHHRATTSAKLYKTVHPGTHALDFSCILSMLLPFDQVIIHDYNVVVEILQDITPTRFLARLSRVCSIKPLSGPAKPRHKFSMTLYLNHEWYELKWKKKILRQHEDHDVIFDGFILNKHVLKDILGIDDVRTDSRLKYVEGIAGVEGVADKVHKNAYRVGFCFYPVKMEEIVKTADAGKTLPPKSTWFEPRVKNGIISQAF